MIRLILVAAFALSLAGFNGQAMAQSAAPQASSSVVVLDIATIRREAASVKAIREQIIGYQKALQGDIQKEEDTLRTAQQELAKKQTLLAPEAFADERKKFEQRVVSVQQLVQQRRRELESAQNNAMIEVERNLNEIVAKMAADNGYSMVLRRSQVVVVSTQLDITKTVLQELDKRLPTVKVEPPAN